MKRLMFSLIGLVLGLNATAGPASWEVDWKDLNSIRKTYIQAFGARLLTPENAEEQAKLDAIAKQRYDDPDARYVGFDTNSFESVSVGKLSQPVAKAVCKSLGLVLVKYDEENQTFVCEFKPNV